MRGSAVVRKSGKLTPAEMAVHIIREGEFVPGVSGVFTHYYDAFGQRWKITYATTSGNVKSVEQYRKDGTPVRF